MAFLRQCLQEVRNLQGDSIILGADGGPGGMEAIDSMESIDSIEGAGPADTPSIVIVEAPPTTGAGPDTLPAI